MSTFGGKLEEINWISIDRFTGTNQRSKAFFLSHCHEDHMCGIAEEQFRSALTRDNSHLYVSHVSAAILKNMHPKICPFLKELDMYSPTTIEGPNENISVIAIPAGHCPGSVMFLFESQTFGSILYTGDFRISPKDVGKIKAFYTDLNEKKRIRSVYLDTTFFLKSYTKFPSRSESLNEICNIITKWTSMSEYNVIHLKLHAKYGYEYLFMKLYQRLKMPIHVNEEVYAFHSKVPELYGAVTKSPNHPTRIHTACGENYMLICKHFVPKFNIATINVSAFRWRNIKENEITDNVAKWHNVCFSTHASYEECKALLQFLQPEQIYANVFNHRDPESVQEVRDNIEEFKSTYKPIESQTEEKNIDLFSYEGSNSTSESNEENCDLFNILDSPPTKRRLLH